jgi:hypothetical protein
VPAGVIAHVAAQLDLPATTDLAPYRTGDARWDHAAEIRQRFGYRDFSEQPEHFRLVQWLYTRAWLSAERPSVLFDLATARLVERKIMVPGVTTLTRLVAAVRDRAAQRLWRRLAELPDAEMRQRLEDLLVVPVGSRQSPLDRLRTAPVRASAPALVDALHRLVEVRALGAGRVDLSSFPAGRLKVLELCAQLTPGLLPDHSDQLHLRGRQASPWPDLQALDRRSDPARTCGDGGASSTRLGRRLPMSPTSPRVAVDGLGAVYLLDWPDFRVVRFSPQP